MREFISIVLALAVIILALAFHETGHFVLARLFKVNVKDYSIGIGPRLLSFKTRRGMRVSFRPFPVAAYVVLDSRELRELYADEKESKKKAEVLEALPKGLRLVEDASGFARLAIYSAGIAANLLFFIVLFLVAKFGVHYQNDYGAVLRTWFVSLGNTLSFQSSEGSSIVSALAGVAKSANVVQVDYGRFVLNTLVLINLTMALLNVLPMPPLDGFKLLVTGAQLLLKRPFSKRTNNIISYVSLVLLLYFLAAVLTSEVRSFV